MSLDEFFEGYDESRRIFDALYEAVVATGEVEMSVTKSQVAFRHGKAFAWAWIPDKYLHGRHAPLVLSLVFDRRDESPRWKEVVQPAPGRFMHHLELRSEAEIDEQVRQWVQEAMPPRPMTG